MALVAHVRSEQTAPKFTRHRKIVRRQFRSPHNPTLHPTFEIDDDDIINKDLLNCHCLIVPSKFRVVTSALNKVERFWFQFRKQTSFTKKDLVVVCA